MHQRKNEELHLCHLPRLHLHSCVLKTCKGRMYTVDEELPASACTQRHDHDSAECEAKATVSSIKQFEASTRTHNHLIYAQTTGSQSQAIRQRLPAALACKKAAQRARRKADPSRYFEDLSETFRSNVILDFAHTNRG